MLSFRMGQFSLLWVDQMHRLKFDVDCVDCEWGTGVDLAILRSKLQADYGKKIKAVAVVHNETATGVTNNIGAIRAVLGELACRH